MIDTTKPQPPALYQEPRAISHNQQWRQTSSEKFNDSRTPLIPDKPCIHVAMPTLCQPFVPDVSWVTMYGEVALGIVRQDVTEPWTNDTVSLRCSPERTYSHRWPRLIYALPAEQERVSGFCEDLRKRVLI